MGRVGGTRGASTVAALGVGAMLVAGCVQTASIAPDGPVDPNRLMGESPDAIVADLGEPEMRRQERPVEVWQYRSEACVFDVYFDSASPAVEPVVVFYEARSRSEGSADASNCLRQILALNGSSSDH